MTLRPSRLTRARGAVIERRYRTLRSVFLKKPDDRADDRNRADSDRIQQFPDGYGQNGGGE